ncbi:MAG TPA: T9SS type A sorting domain-containing protein [Bacteroidales bacterium]|jgi:polyhydroxybutyrate depolymerase|nr:T9SS type A sorting domain-containing protein [Bacteroidales bacterium]HNV95838.1 T9SS type A sorting domain-containing protein [Bacteroidales bacterium]HOU98322.1 T9SS type A sorting domain-containing protein [Bacteroidales bacterium]
MKRIILLFFVCFFSLSLVAQDLVTMNFGGQSRKYLKYIPASYSAQNPVPLVICLHGLGDNINNFKNIGMHLIGDTAGFITIYPEAVNSMFGTAWNSGASYMGFILNSNIDDVGFLMAIIDSISAQYSINAQRIYFCGFSMGGFMSQRMACEKSNNVAAIASVAGTIGASLTCSPTRAVPVCHFHGTADSQVSYSANQYGMNAEQMVRFWVQNNSCDTNYLFQTYPDIVNDSISVESYYYNSQNHTADVMFYKAIGADHQWLYPPVNDIDYTVEIWKFLKKFQLVSQGLNEIKFNKDFLYPNPASNKIMIHKDLTINGFCTVEIQNIAGVTVKTCLLTTQNEINVSSLNEGYYTVKLTSNDQIYTQKILIKK